MIVVLVSGPGRTDSLVWYIGDSDSVVPHSSTWPHPSTYTCIVLLSGRSEMWTKVASAPVQHNAAQKLTAIIY